MLKTATLICWLAIAIYNFVEFLMAIKDENEHKMIATGLFASIAVQFVIYCMGRM